MLIYKLMKNKKIEYDKKSHILPQKCFFCGKPVEIGDVKGFKKEPTHRQYYHRKCVPPNARIDVLIEETKNNE